MNRPYRWSGAVVAAVFAATLAGCGGGGSSEPERAAEAPAARDRAQAVNQSGWVTVPVQADPTFQNLTIPADAVTRGMWSAVQPWPLNGLHVVLLPNGRVLSYGSSLDGAQQDGHYLDLWDPTQGFAAASHQTSYRPDLQNSFCSTSTFLVDGRLMISGGNGYYTSLFYTPSTNVYAQSTANLADERWYSTMLTLPDGRPAIFGGMVPYSEGMQANPSQAIAQGLASMTPEVFEATGWRSLFGAYSRDAFGPDYLRASYPRVWVAPDGRVFGLSAETMWYLDATGSGSIAVAGPFKEGPNAATLPNVGATNTAVMYAPGKILVAGGNGSYVGDALPASAKTTTIDINGSSPVVAEQTAMANPRRFGNAIVLPNGQVVVTGGTTYGNNNGANSVFAAEIWNPATRTWRVVASAAIYRGYHSFSILMPNGTVLSTGGGAPGPVNNVNAEVYYPPSLFRTVGSGAQLAPRPVIAAISGLSYPHGATLQVDMAAAGAVSQLVLIGTSNGTHSFNVGQRRIPLSFTQDTIRLTATLPGNTVAPPGYYQLIALDASGVPSQGTIIALGEGVGVPPVVTTPYNPPDLSASINAPIVTVGATASYSVAAVSGTTYSWDFGDGSAATSFGTSASATHAFAAPGVYGVTLNARASNGAVSRRSFVQAVTAPPSARSPATSSATALENRSGLPSRLWVVNPDGDSVAVIDTGSNARVAEVGVGASPRSVAVAPDGRVWIVNKGSASISIVSPASLAVVQTVNLPRGSQPHGLAFAPGGGSAFVVLEASGQLLKLDGASGAQQASVAVGANARGIGVSGDATTLLVSRFITPPLSGESTATITTTSGGGEVLVVNPSTLAITRTVALRHSDKPDTEIQGGGVPNYLAAPVISPDGSSAWVSGKQDNVKRGALRNGQPLNFQNSVRAISSRIDLPTLAEDYARRIDHDNAGVGSAAAFHPSGAYLFVALETSRRVAVVDASGGRELLKVDVGRAPQGLSVSTDGRTLYVQNFMDRTVTVLDLTPLVRQGELRVPLVATIATAGTERLPAPVLLGKQFFFDARDPRLARDSYLSCASCHSDAGHDGRVWDFTGFGEGLRNTPPVRGRGGMGQGFLHWSANFDEVQDFEKQIRDLAGGSGLMSDAQYASGTRGQPLGDPKAGQSADLDALAAYVASLDQFPATPFRASDGSLTAAALAGKAVFGSAGCVACHGGAEFTNSGDGGMLKDIGTVKSTSGGRLGAALPGIDIPTLRDVWATAPYLHDGSAATLADAVGAHRGTSLSSTDLANLVEYLRQIGAEEPGVPGPIHCASESANCIVPAGMTADVYFGANGKFVVKSAVAGVVACTNATFGSDPIAGTVKSCSYLPNTLPFAAGVLPVGSQACAGEGGTCTVPGGAEATVYYGSGGRYVARSGIVGSVVCNASTFGSDPNAGSTDACAYFVTRAAALDNLALRKPVQQSSTDNGGDASRAVDGIVDGAWTRGSVTHTSNGAQPWWQVDLGSQSRVGSVRVWNRTDCCGDRLSNFVVFVSATDMSSRTLAALLADPAVTSRDVAAFPNGAPAVDVGVGSAGRYVRVQLRGTGNPLSLAEVQVFGTQGSVYSVGKAATQSSTAFGGVASRAVDGNTNPGYSANSVTHTDNENQPWWQVDLGATGRIDQVQLWNRLDCCSTRLSEFAVFVSSSDMTGRSLAQLKSDPAVLSYVYTAMTVNPSLGVPVFRNGRYVRVQLTVQDYLSLAEVQVSGQSPP